MNRPLLISMLCVTLTRGTPLVPAPAEPSPVVSVIVPDADLQKVLAAMEVLAASEHVPLTSLVGAPEVVAQAVLDRAREKDLDPLVLVAIAWTESRFRPGALGDHKNGKPRSCGITQIRTDLPDRPTCAALLDPEVALGWTAEWLVETASVSGKLRLDRYNGGTYEVRIWRTVDWIRRQLPKEA